MGEPPTNLSKRTPHKKTQNLADDLDEFLHENKLNVWGFVTYRCTYQSDSDWGKFMDKMLENVTSDLEYYNGMDLLDSFAPTVFEDPSFKGATVAFLRDHFNNWTKAALYQENPDTFRLDDFPGLTYSPRYKYFIRVDQEVLQSVLEDASSLDGFVHLVQGEWEPDEDELDELAEGQIPTEFEPLEGCTLERVGWMKVTSHVQFGFVDYCLCNCDWDFFYVRPPAIQENLA